ncbi:MAG TPA: isochorismate synthase, partial [Pseudonocardia sp.]|nr:isochorismate synthase [Pseudonocardia sp.]
MTIAPLPTGLGVRTRLVDDPVRLLDLLPDREGALAWVHGGEGLVGWGEVARLATAGPARFRDADRWWRSFADRLSVADEVGLPGTGPVAFTSFTF